ncbi:DNA-binding transcriptional regulator OxyR [Acidisoma sp. 7E03]
MNLRELQYLLALAEHRNFRRAAEACFVSQPTLSTQIRKLEEELGVDLVERATKSVMLTRAGAAVAARARVVLGEVTAIREEAKRLSQPDAGALHLGIFPTLGPYLLPQVIPELRRRLPDLDLFLTEEKSDVLLDRLRNGKLDAAILALPLHDAQLHAEPLFEEPFLLAVPRHHPLARRTHLRVEELAAHELLLLEDGHCLRDQALDVCQLAGARETSEFRATSLETLRQMVMAGIGMTLLPALAVHGSGTANDHIRLLRFDGGEPRRALALVWRRSSALGPLLGRITEICRSVIPGLVAAAEEKAAA